VRSWGALVLLNVVLLLPVSLQDLEPWLALGLCGDMALLAGLLAWSRRPWLVATLYSGLLVYELDRLVGMWLMGQDPLLFDQFLLLRHLGVLATDLYGLWGIVALLGAVLGLGLAHWAVIALFRVAQEARGLRWALAAAPVAALLALVGPWPARWVAPDLAMDLGESWTVWSRLSDTLDELHPELQDLELRTDADVEFHIIESYGRMLDEDALRPAWHAALADTTERLEGWSAVSAWVKAPVSGGRSWLADATLLMGFRLAHQSEYQAIAGSISGLGHMPGWFRDRGYATVVMRPKDKARPGIALRNDFDWMHTVFAEELDYTGAHYGWGGVPDQYSMGWLRDELWDSLPAPRFLFAHLVGSHAPWTDLPPLVDDWRTLDDGSAGADEHRDLDLAREAKKFKRKKKTKASPVGKLSELGGDYQQAVLLDLEVLTRDLERPRDRPAVVVWMGDHQPPMLSRKASFDVPVHVLSTDPALLEGLAEQGFQPGMVPSEEVGTMQGLYSRLVRSLSH
jgi:hypothetical protein